MTIALPHTLSQWGAILYNSPGSDVAAKARNEECITLTTVLRATALLAFSLVPLASAAADDDTKLVESISPQVADVVTGGS
ncbi:MAG: hypothetical protein ABSA62_02700 [Methyloceanibacter sp.]|jgi:hypothetical protein